MNFFTANQVVRQQRYAFVQPSMRTFASGEYPPHINLEMPNLSPTMEKVCFFEVA